MKTLWLGSNHIGDLGARSIVDSAAKGGLAELEQLRLAGEQSARACIAEILEDLQLGVLTRESLFRAAGNPPGHPDHAKLAERLALPPKCLLLVAQLAMPEVGAWMETKVLPFVGGDQALD